MMQRTKSVQYAVVVSAAVLLAACDSRTDSDTANSNPTIPSALVNAQTVSPDTRLYQDSFLQFSYPADWQISHEDPGLTAELTDPQANANGANATCGVLSAHAPGSSLITETEPLTAILDPLPEPDILFFEVNGVPAARIIGTITAFNVTVDTATQIFYENESQFAHGVFCVGTRASDSDLMFRSMQLN